LFPAADLVSGLELWRSDSSDQGTQLLRDIFPGPADSLSAGSDPLPIHEFVTAGRYAFFSADDGAHGRDLWRSDGTGGGTTLVRDIDRRPIEPWQQDYDYRLTVVGDRVAFTPYAAAIGREPWVTDGTPGGTYAIDDIAPGAVSSVNLDYYFSASAQFIATREHLFFAADDKRHGLELWAVRRGDLDAPRPCPGDCDGDKRVVISELVRAVTVALGATPTSACAAVDEDRDGVVVIAELVRAVTRALSGC
jgi:ELWxxDGT repeat protein